MLDDAECFLPDDKGVDKHQHSVAKRQHAGAASPRKDVEEALTEAEEPGWRLEATTSGALPRCWDENHFASVSSLFKQFVCMGGIGQWDPFGDDGLHLSCSQVIEKRFQCLAVQLVGL